MRTEYVVVICTASDGTPSAPVYEVEVTEDEYQMGIHYDKAEDMASDDRYETPFKCFDNAEHDELFLAVNFIKLKRKAGLIK